VLREVEDHMKQLNYMEKDVNEGYEDALIDRSVISGFSPD
jgi:hypothetical protein